MPYLIILTLIALATAEAADRIAVWDPEVGTPQSRFKLDVAHCQAVADWLAAAGLEVDRIPGMRITEAGALDPDRHAAVVSFGGALPTAAVERYAAFAKAGGVLIHLGGVPFFIRVAKGTDGWEVEPKKPYTWQTESILNLVGLKAGNDDAMKSAAVRHEPTALLMRYVNGVAAHDGMVPGAWLYPVGDARCYALMRSSRIDGADLTPQVFAIRKGGITALIAGNEDQFFTGRGTWAHGRSLVVGLARLAIDLRRGAAQLDERDLVQVPGKPLAPTRPLAMRRAGAGIDPDRVKPLARWGRFDGSALDLGPPLASGGRRELSATSTATDVPGALEPGGAIILPGVTANGPVALRVRFAYDRDGAALRVEQDGMVRWHERLIYLREQGLTNLDMYDYAGQPYEDTRLIACVPGKPLTITNTGQAALHLDALQIEAATAGPAWMIGFGENSGKAPEALGRTWSSMRSTLRTQHARAAGDPERFAVLDRQMQDLLRVGAPLHLIFEGTSAWSAMSDTAYAEGKAAGRAHTVAADPQRYLDVVRWVGERYGSRIRLYEIWNEANTRHFWRGTIEQYEAFYKALAPEIRRLDPTAEISLFGFAGTTVATVDPWLVHLQQSGVLADADVTAIHCYHNRGAWDARYGLFEGHVFSLGVDTPIAANEQGVGVKDRSLQAELTDVGMARLTATPATRIEVFTAEPSDSHVFALIDGKLQTQPAYAAVSDYLALCGPAHDGRRCPVALSASDGSALAGVYAAAAQWPDGTRTVILNRPRRGLEPPLPADAPPVPVVLRLPIAGPVSATASRAGAAVPVEVAIIGGSWAELKLPADGRTVIRLAPR